MQKIFQKIAWNVKRLLRLDDTHTMLFWASLAGLIGALATIAFRESLAGFQWLIVGHAGSMVEMARVLPWPVRVILPCVGGLIAGAILIWASRYQADPKTDYMEAIAQGDGKISFRQTCLRSLSSLSTIASGGSIGREGSMIQLAAMCASVLGRSTRFSPQRLRLLVACGAAAGITAAYNAPIASAFFISEIVLGTMAMESLGPIIVAAVVANITMRDFAGYQPTYEMPAFAAVNNVEVVLFVGLGIITGLLAPQFLRLLGTVKGLFQIAGLSLPLRLALGGLMVGVISVWIPQVWGNGYSVVNSLLHEPWLWTAVLLTLIAKVVATALTTGSGAIGGIFTPTLFVGAAIGDLFGQSMHALWPDFVSASFMYAIVGMGAFLAAATSAPLMAILMIFEMTSSYQIMLPLMLACVVSYFVARTNSNTAMYDITLQRNLGEQERLRLLNTQMQDLIQPAETVLPLSASFGEMISMFSLHPVKYIYIVDDAQRYQGVVALQDLTSVLIDEIENSSRVARDFIRHDFLPLITPDMSLDDALKHFLEHHGERLPVVKSTEQPFLLGAVHKTSLLEAYVRLNRVP